MSSFPRLPPVPKELTTVESTVNGKHFSKWIKGALIGSGSFGSVYLVMDAQSSLLMAIKQVEIPVGSADNEERKRAMLVSLEQEIGLLKDLKHENLVQYLDVSRDEHFLNILMEFVAGGSVAALLNNYGAFEDALARNFIRQILKGLLYLHERDIIHGNIKSRNILVDGAGRIKISDFGISKIVEEQIHDSSRVQDAIFYSAPEIVKKTSYTCKADIWSVGCVAIELISAKRPWAECTAMQAIYSIGSSARPAFPTEASGDAISFLEKTFEIEAENRLDAAQLLQCNWINRGDTEFA